MIYLLRQLSVRLDYYYFVIEYNNLNTIRLITKEIATLQTKLRHVNIHEHWLRQEHQAAVSYTHLTLPTILLV